ncbi:hypothetical protein OUZ56_029984 [Daphnia magna]|uniref:Uncharacterized protein n=1 Tax=Daphnia magna TaxID=35525 RepID=A0ABR0B8G0_9CRUS|nr:hypothetical protein OUZ56_029984 [Daphnia magna]
MYDCMSITRSQPCVDPFITQPFNAKNDKERKSTRLGTTPFYIRPFSALENADPEEVPIASAKKRSREEADDSASRKFTPSDARVIRKYYESKFQKRSVYLHCPKIDHSMARRVKEKRGPELTKVEQKEKALTSMQFKLLDIARPLLFISESLAADKTDVNLDVRDACRGSIRLLGHAFTSITAKRRENILKFMDPRFESLQNEPERFDLDESDELFGRSFLRSMVEDADNDAKLRIVNRASNSRQRQSGHSGSSVSSHHHGRGRQSASSNFPSGTSRGGFSNNFPEKEGVRIPFISIPSVPFAQSNIGMSAELEAICDAEVQSLL